MLPHDRRGGADASTPASTIAWQFAHSSTHFCASSLASASERVTPSTADRERLCSRIDVVELQRADVPANPHRRQDPPASRTRISLTASPRGDGFRVASPTAVAVAPTRTKVGPAVQPAFAHDGRRLGLAAERVVRGRVRSSYFASQCRTVAALTPSSARSRGSSAPPRQATGDARARSAAGGVLRRVAGREAVLVHPVRHRRGAAAGLARDRLDRTPAASSDASQSASTHEH